MVKFTLRNILVEIQNKIKLKLITIPNQKKTQDFTYNYWFGYWFYIYLFIYWYFHQPNVGTRLIMSVTHVTLILNLYHIFLILVKMLRNFFLNIWHL